MGMCFGIQRRQVEDDDAYQHTDIAVVKSRIAAKRLPIIWMNGVEGCGMHNHGCNIAERFGYAYIPLENLIRQEMINTTARGRIIKTRIANSRRIPDRIVLDLIKEKMIAAGDTRGYLISEFPQNPRQANLFVKEFGKISCILIMESQSQINELTENPPGDRKITQPNRKISQKERKIDFYKDLKITSGKCDTVVEKINVNEKPADVFLKIEAAILDRLAATQT
ncbi:Adenylate kinase 1 [Carabus blaptoides fortunei]